MLDRRLTRDTLTLHVDVIVDTLIQYLVLNDVNGILLIRANVTDNIIFCCPAHGNCHETCLQVNVKCRSRR